MEYFNSSSYDWRISQCCQFHDKALAKRYNFGTTTKTFALKADGKQRVQAKAIENCSKLVDILSTYFNTQPINLRSFRISSELFPCYTLDFTKDWYAEIWDDISILLERAGNFAKQNNVRLSVHPGQYTVLASNKAEVVENSVKDLEYHALYGKLMNIPAKEFVMNIHLQGLYGGKHLDGIKRFATNFHYLSDYAQDCLAVENEDKPNGYDIAHTLELAQLVPIRCTLDTHHYACHRMTESEKVVVNGKTVNRKIRDVKNITVNDDMFKEAVKSWRGFRPLFHTSQSFPLENPDYWMKVNAHSEVFEDEEHMSRHIPMLQYADFDIEAKNKEVAVQGFYAYIQEEQEYAGEALVAKRIPNDW
jgi:UV DNA damage repair endonuclease